jgi:hypothetical protein
MIDIHGRSFVGLPENLTAKDQNGLPRLFSIVPGFNRETRRCIAAALKHWEVGAGKRDSERILVAFSQPELRRQAFWKEIDGNPPPKGYAELRHYATVDLWLLRAVEPDLLSLEPLGEDEMRGVCPPWDQIAAGLEAWAANSLATVDKRYFALWPRIVEMLRSWDSLSQDDRYVAVNGAFALSSISGSSWFVEEAQRVCPAVVPEYARLTELRPGDNEPFNEESLRRPEIVDLTEPEAQPDEETDMNGREHAHQQFAAGRWRKFGDDLKEVATRLSDGELDAGLIAALEDLLATYGPLKRECPPASQIDIQLECLFKLLDEIGRRHPGGALDQTQREEIKGMWRIATDKVTTSNINFDSVLSDAKRAEHAGRETIDRLLSAVKARSDTEAEYADQRAAEQGATTWPERREARRALAALEERLASYRRNEEAIEEELSRLLRPSVESESDASGSTAQLPAAQHQSDRDELKPAGAVPITPIGRDAFPEAKEGRAERAEATLEQAVPVQASPLELALRPDINRERVSKDLREPEATSQEDELFSASAGNLCSPIWQALRIGNVALAYHAAVAIRALNPDVVLPPPALLAAVAFAQQLQSPSGAIAEAITSCFGDIDRNDFEVGPEPWRLANNLLLLAACLKPLVLAPNSGVSGVSQYVHLGAGLEPLFNVQELLRDYGQRLKGNRLDAAALGAVRSRTAWEAEFEQLQRDIAEWAERAQRFTTNFRAATNVWRQWLHGGGEIERLLTRLKSADPAAATEVQSFCELFGRSDRFRALVVETDTKRLRRSRGEEIYAGAFQQLAGKSAEAVSLSKRWLSLIEARPDHGDYLNRILTELQSKLAKVRSAAFSAVDSPVQEDAWGLVEAARVTVKAALSGVFDVFAGDRVGISSEQSPAALLGGQLLLTGGVSLDADWQPECTPEQLLEEIKSYLVRRPSIRDAFNGDMARGDLANARRLLDLTGNGAPGDNNEFAIEFERGTNRKREEIRSECKKVEEEISLALAYGVIGEKERGRLTSRVAALELGPLADLRFDRAQQVLADIQSEIARGRAERAGQLSAGLDRLTMQHPEYDGAVIHSLIDEGDFPTATEYLHRAEQDPLAELTLPSVRDLFNDFFPQGAQQLERLLSTVDASRVNKIIAEGKTASGISFGRLSSGRAEASAATWAQWCRLKASRTPSVETIKKFIQALGFRDPQVIATGSGAGQMREFTLTAWPISAREVCQIPHFGSRADGKYRLVCTWDSPTQEDFRVLAGDATSSRPTIAIYFGALSESRRRELAHISREERKLSFLLLDELLLLFICAEENVPLAAFFQCTSPFTHSDPFVTTSSVVPPEMFFGRSDELASIKSLDGRCFVYGGRQLGKTALLRQAEREFHNPREHRIAAWVDLKRVARPDEIWVPIWRELRKHGVISERIAEPRRTDRAGKRIDEFLNATEEWLTANPTRRILLLLDESDRFLEFDARDGFVDTRRLKGVMEGSQRRFKVVFAGLHNVLRATEHANHPLAHFGEAIEVGPLIRPDDLRAARDLVLRPLMASGFAFESERRVDRILAQTNYYPSLIQLYCSKLLQELLRNNAIGLDRRKGPRYTITAKHLDAVYGRQDLREEIQTKFLLTLQLDPRYNLITYALAHEVQQGRITLDEGGSVEEFRRVAEAWWKEGFARTSESEFRVLLREMVGLGVLRQVGGAQFTLRNPNVLLLLGSASEIEEELCRPKELPLEYEPRYWRMAMGSDAAAVKRDPLTVSQVADVVSPRNGVVVIAGSEAAGVFDVQRTVKAMTETGFFVSMEEGGADLASFQRTLERVVERKSGGTTVFFVGPESPWTSGWLRYALARIDRLKSKDSPVRVVMTADPTTLRLLIEEGIPDAVSFLSLTPWPDAYLREWLQETNQPSDSDVRSRILADTGGWPEFVYEWKSSGREGSDVVKDARNRLKRLGIEDASGLLDLDGKLVSELQTGDMGERYKKLIRWAEMLGLLRSGGDGRVYLDPYVAELLMRA